MMGRASVDCGSLSHFWDSRLSVVAPCSNPGMPRPISQEVLRPGRMTTARRKSLALDLLSQGHTFAHVRKVLGINRVTVFRLRQDDPSFAEAYCDAMKSGTDVIRLRPASIPGRQTGRRIARVLGSARSNATQGATPRDLSRYDKPEHIHSIDHNT